MIKRLQGLYERYFCQCDNGGERFILYVVWGVYCVVTFVVATHHESWFDETQAYLMAREVSPWELVTTYIRYEGTPPLWHLLLMVPVKFGLPIESLQVISVACMCLGVYVFLLSSPLPIGVKILLPLNYFIFFQYTTVARSYTLIFPILALLAVYYPARWERRWPYIVSLVVFSLISMHTALLAGGLVIADIIEAWIGWKKMDRTAKISLMVLVGVFAIDTIAIVLMCFPPGDLTPPTHIRPRLLQFCYADIRMVTEAISGESLLSFLMLFYIMHFSFKKGRLLVCWLPLVLLLLFFGSILNKPWHAGVILCWVVFVSWICSYDSKKWPVSLANTMIALAVIQLPSLYTCIKNDWELPYSGAGDAASAIKKILPEVRSIEAYGFASHAVLAYFPQGRIKFSNSPEPWHEFYTWSPRAIPAVAPKTINAHADLVLITSFAKGESNVDPETIRPRGYKLAGTFPGYCLWKDTTYENYCYYLFQREAVSP